MRKLLFGILFAPMAFGTNTASADPWPASVVGTWSVQANQNSLVMRISSQGVIGNCRAILGTLQNVGSIVTANIEGFYCPFSGRISFVRKDTRTNDTYQTWTGNLSDPGTKLLIGGTFTSPSFNAGEYGFYAVK
ncbi:MAG: hypothetical protein ACREC0_12820 [Methylocella sp.]